MTDFNFLFPPKTSATTNAHFTGIVLLVFDVLELCLVNYQMKSLFIARMHTIEVPLLHRVDHIELIQFEIYDHVPHFPGRSW